MADIYEIKEFPFKVKESTEILVPGHIKLLGIGPLAKPGGNLDGSSHLVAWFLVNKYDHSNETKFEFTVYGNNNPLPDLHNRSYVGTVQDAPWTWHVYVKELDISTLR